MCPFKKATTLAERYDQALLSGHQRRLPLDAPRPVPTCAWPEENIRLLEKYNAWLLDGGTAEYATHTIYLPMAGHILGMNPIPHQQINLEGDFERALDYVRAKQVGAHWLQACRNGLEKFRRFMRLERGLGEINHFTPYDIALHTQDLPAWLVSKLERFQHIQRRNWRAARIEQSICRFWCGHIRIWRFLCVERAVSQLADLKRQHILDYVDMRLGAGRAVTGVNGDLHVLHSFLLFLQDEGCLVPQSLLRIPSLKVPDSLPN